MGRGEGGGFRMGSMCISEIKKKKKKILMPGFISVVLFFVIFIMPMHPLYLCEYFLMTF